MAKRTNNAGQAPVKPGEAVPPLDYGALVAAIGQAHQTAHRHAVQAINVALTFFSSTFGWNGSAWCCIMCQ